MYSLFLKKNLYLLFWKPVVVPLVVRIFWIVTIMPLTESDDVNNMKLTMHVSLTVQV